MDFTEDILKFEQAWDVAKRELAAIAKLERPFTKDEKEILLIILENERPKNRKLPAPQTHHINLQLYFCVKAIKEGARENYSLSSSGAGSTGKPNVFELVSEATNNSFDTVRGAWRANQKRFKQKG